MNRFRSGPSSTSRQRGGEGRCSESKLARSAVASAQLDPGAVHFLYVRFAPEVYSGVRGLVRSDRDAEEVTSRVFADLTARTGSYDEDEEPFVIWLLRLARSSAQEYAAHQPLVDTVAGRSSP